MNHIDSFVIDPRRGSNFVPGWSTIAIIPVGDAFHLCNHYAVENLIAHSFTRMDSLRESTNVKMNYFGSSVEAARRRK